MSTIQDVARQAAVSISTVSNVLNGRTDRMRKETLARVEAAIQALEFRPNSLARRLKTGQTPLLGLLVPSIANPMYGYIARMVETFAQERHGYRILVGNTYRDREKEDSFFQDLLDHGVRRVIVISSLADERHFENAVRRGMAVVSYDRRATPGSKSKVDHVTPDNFEAARLAASHLIDHGHKRLAFATIAGMTMSRSAKIAGFQAASARHKDVQARILDGGPLHAYGDSVVSEVGRALGQRIATSRWRPTGIVAVNDLMALGLMAGLREAGMRVPQDISIVGIDGLFLSSLSNPGLTTVELPVSDMASAMVERVMAREPGGEAEASEAVFVPTNLVRRESVAAAPETAAPPRAAKARSAKAGGSGR